MPLTIDNGIIRYGSRIISPQSMYRDIFNYAHQTHNGIDATLKLIEKKFYWIGMRSSVRNMNKNCEICTQHRFKMKNTTHTWPSEGVVWNRLHMDFGYHKQVGNMLIVVDSYSGWLEALKCNNRTTNARIINHLRSIFARFGIPKVMVCDNAPEFTNEQLYSWLEKSWL